MKTVQLFSLDFGSTTSCAMLVEASVERNQVSGKMHFENPRIVYKSDAVFTPIENNLVNEHRISVLIKDWLAESGATQENLFSGGAIFTGLTAKKGNVSRIAEQVNALIGNAIINTVDDPNLESWLAYLGNFSYAAFGHQPVLNLDIGGGTTNPALGIGKSVLATGCYAIGARHFQFEAGTYCLTVLSDSARQILAHLGLNYELGQTLTNEDVERIAEFYVEQLKNIKTGQAVCDFLIEVPLEISEASPKVLLSGGIGEVYYHFLRSGELPSKSYFGDLGIALVKAILNSDLLDSQDVLPQESGRATVYGMALFNTEISGATIFISHDDLLPLNEIPMLGRLRIDESQTLASQQYAQQLLRTQYKLGGAIFLEWDMSTLEQLKQRSQQLREWIRSILPKDSLHSVAPLKPLVFFVQGDVALTFGNYLTQWRAWQHPILIIDDVPHKDASFVNIGRKQHQVVPVSFYGIHQMRGSYA